MDKKAKQLAKHQNRERKSVDTVVLASHIGIAQHTRRCVETVKKTPITSSWYAEATMIEGAWSMK